MEKGKGLLIMVNGRRKKFADREDGEGDIFLFLSALLHLSLTLYARHDISQNPFAGPELATEPRTAKRTAEQRLLDGDVFCK